MSQFTLVPATQHLIPCFSQTGDSGSCHADFVNNFNILQIYKKRELYLLFSKPQSWKINVAMESMQKY